VYVGLCFGPQAKHVTISRYLFYVGSFFYTLVLLDGCLMLVVQGAPTRPSFHEFMSFQNAGYLLGIVPSCVTCGASSDFFVSGLVVG